MRHLSASLLLRSRMQRMKHTRILVFQLVIVTSLGFGFVVHKMLGTTHMTGYLSTIWRSQELAERGRPKKEVTCLGRAELEKDN